MIRTAIKCLLAAWLGLWLPLHLLAYPPSTLLWWCGYGNVLVVLGVCLESRLILSWQAVGLLVPQGLYAADALARLVTGARGGGTSYLFDPALPLEVRALSLFHFVLPVVLVWALARRGYDQRALAAAVGDDRARRARVAARRRDQPVVPAVGAPACPARAAPGATAAASARARAPEACLPGKGRRRVVNPLPLATSVRMGYAQGP
jgi:hypothetical protein